MFETAPLTFYNYISEFSHLSFARNDWLYRLTAQQWPGVLTHPCCTHRLSVKSGTKLSGVLTPRRPRPERGQKKLCVLRILPAVTLGA